MSGSNQRDASNDDTAVIVGLAVITLIVTIVAILIS